MSKKQAIFWGLTAGIFLTGIGLSISERDGHYAFEWRGAELMAQPKLDEYHDIASLQIYNRVLLQLQEYYVDPSRLDPNFMISTTLDNLQKNVPELLLVFDKKVKEKPTQVVVNIHGLSKTFSLDNINNLWEMSLRLRAILSFIQDYLPPDVKPRELEYDAINGMLSALDPHSVILPPEVYRSMAEGNRGKFGGLGIVVRMVDGLLIIVDPIEGNVPAAKAGLKEGDQILSIDGTPTLNMNIQEAVDLLKGEPDTTVHLLVKRKDWKEPKKIDVVRAEIEIPSLESAALDDKIAYIKLKSFQGNSQSDMTKALEKLRTEMDGMNGLILDLRGNPGGLLDQAVLIADNFLQSGTIVTTVGVNNSLKKPRKASKETTEPEYPIVVLMDYSSASASEILAGALKNNDRALIVGDTSFGKGSVQVLYELPDKSALKITIGQYLTPGEQSIQSVGIVPDIRLVPMRALKDDIDLYPKTWVRREESLGGHLDNENVKRDLKPSYNLRYLSKRYAMDDDELDDDSVITLEDIDKILKNKPKTNKPVDDPEVRLAREILLKIGDIHERNNMIVKFLEGATSLQIEEDRALVEALSDIGIDWSSCTKPAAPDVELTISTDRFNNIVSAGDTMVIRTTATNRSSAPICRLAARTVSSLSRTNDKELIYGRIEPGQSITREITLKTNHAQSERVDNFDVNLYLDDGTPVPQTPIASASTFITTMEQPHPAFTIHYAIIDRDENGKTGNGLLDDDEEVTMRIWVSNDGPGTAEKPLIFLKNKAPEIKLMDARFETEALHTGERVMRDFKFKTTKVGANDVNLELHIYDKASTQSLVEKIAFQTSKTPALNSNKVEQKQQTARVMSQTPLRVSPIASANSLNDVAQGATVKVDAVVGDYSHVTADPLMGWVLSSMLEPSEDAVTPITPGTIATIPRISLASMRHITDQESIDIHADVTSYASLVDYYIFVSNEVDHNYTVEKVAYAPLSEDLKHIHATVPLAKGLNSIRIFVRDKNKSEAHETILVYRK